MAQNEASGWAGWVAFASFMMMLTGAFGALVGLTALFRDTFFVVTQEALVTVDVTAWGWWHLLLGVLVFFAGIAVLSGKVWGRTIGVTLAILSALTNMLFIPYYPVWSLLIIAVDIAVIYALTVHGRELAEVE